MIVTKPKTTWRTVRLGDVADVIPGFAFKSKDFSETGIPVLKITEIQPPYVSFQKSDRVNIQNYDKNKLKKYFIHKGDYVVAMTGATIGKVGKVVDDIEVLLNQRVAKIEAKDFVDPGFIYYAVDSSAFQGFINQIASGSSAQANISGDDIGEFEVNLPDLPTQKKIAEILGAYDAKIENNNLIIKNLEATAQVVFNEWFVKFRFPSFVKTTAGKLGYKKVKMVESELGLIPEGWGVKKISEILDINPLTPTADKSMPYVEMRDLPEAGMYFSFQQKRLHGGGTRFKNHDTLLARITPCLENGKTGYVNCLEKGEVATGSTEFLVLRPKLDTYREYTYLLARSGGFRSFAIGLMVGSSGRQRVSGPDLARFKLAQPSAKFLDEFHKITATLFGKIKEAANENQKLKASRDQLLKRLI